MGSTFEATPLHDSGQRRVFASGAQRDRGAEKTRPDLMSPFFMLRMGEHMLKGALKYNSWNWARGMPNSEYWKSLNRHVQKAAAGLVDEDHLAGIVFNAMCIMHNQEMKRLGILKPEFDDWPVDWVKLMHPESEPDAIPPILPIPPVIDPASAESEDDARSLLDTETRRWVKAGMVPAPSTILESGTDGN